MRHTLSGKEQLPRGNQPTGSSKRGEGEPGGTGISHCKDEVAADQADAGSQGYQCGEYLFHLELIVTARIRRLRWYQHGASSQYS
jgi:hypothetical protein